MIRNKATETKTVTPNFSSGNVDVTPSANKTMTKVTIQKDSDLIAGNVKKDVEIHGITGTYEGTGGATGDHTVDFLYYAIEGGKLVEKVERVFVNDGGSVTPPTISSSLDAVSKMSCALELEDSSYPWNLVTRVWEGTSNTGVKGISINEGNWSGYSVIVSNGVGAYKFSYETNQWNLYKYVNSSWSSIATNVTLSNYGLTIQAGSATNGDNVYVNYKDFTNIRFSLVVGAVYRNQQENGIRKTTLFLKVKATTGLTPTIYFSKSDGSTLTISFGDGSEDQTSTATGNLWTDHTYATAGTYEVKMWISSGSGTFGLGNGTSSTTFIGASTQAYRDSLYSIFLGDNVTLNAYAFYLSTGLEMVNIPKSITQITTYSFRFAYGLNRIVFPNSITTLGTYCLGGCNGLLYASLPNTITSIDSQSFYDCIGIEKIIFPSSLTGFSGAEICYGMRSLRYVFLPNGIATFGNFQFQLCANLYKVNIPNAVSTLTASLFVSCIQLLNGRITLGTNITNVSSSSLSISIPMVVTVLNSTPPSATTTVFGTMNAQSRIYVPVGTESTYKNATGWSTYANFIYEDNGTNRDLFGD